MYAPVMRVKLHIEFKYRLVLDFDGKVTILNDSRDAADFEMAATKVEALGDTSFTIGFLPFFIVTCKKVHRPFVTHHMHDVVI